jgi:translocator protein
MSHDVQFDLSDSICPKLVDARYGTMLARKAGGSMDNGHRKESSVPINVRWPRLLGSILVPVSAGIVGSLATYDELKRWYPTLEKPSFNPPNGVFGPVWTTLYLLMGIAEYLVSQKSDSDPRYVEAVQRARRLYALQLGLNTGWSFLFFKLRSTLAALIELVLLWLVIVATIRAFAGVSRTAALLLVPYLLWTSFAGVLNASIWWKNRDNTLARAVS